MNRRGLNKAGTDLGDSTSCLLTFQHDMLESSCYRHDVDNEKSLAKYHKPRSSTAYRVRDDNEVQKSCVKPRSSTAYRERNDCVVETHRCNPRSSTAHRLRRDEPLSRIKSGSEGKIFESNSLKSNRVAPSHKTYHDNDNMTTTSVSTTTTTTTKSTMSLQSNDCVETIEPIPRENYRLRQVPGRSRPGIRTHRSGSFALRQFKENYDQKHSHRCKTKAEARSQDSIENEVIESTRRVDTVSENATGWVKPALRPYRSVDGSFRVQSDAKSLYCPVETNSVAKNDDIPPRSKGFHQSGMECNGANKFKRSMVEVAPGCSMFLCGIDETMNALHLDRILHAECSSCNTFLACINAASMVLCPGCQTVSPLESISHSYDCVPIMGIGLRVEDILAHVGK